MSAAVIAAGITLLAGIITTLVGLEYRNLKRRIRQLEKGDEDDAEERRSIRQKVNTLWRWAFGREDDETDGGLSQEIQNGFNRIEEDIEDLQRRQETYHETEMSQFERLVNALHDDDDTGVERGDVFGEEE